MTILSKSLRRQLETAIKQAREIAEAAASEALARIAVADANPPPHLTEDNRALRRRLRAHGRALGDTSDAAGAMTTARLQDAAAYEIWHRMLFGRFLVERGLLIHPDLGVAISLAELRDLAQEEGAADEWAMAEQYAAPGLPGVFKPDDPVLLLPVAPEFSKRMRAVLSSLPEDVFTADDSLGWTYQFWRASEKDAVNAAGGKIGAVELPAVTQLFTESYMVKFLLHNTLGAWWAGKVLVLDPGLARDAADEEALREACALSGVAWEFLRFVRDDHGAGLWRPAAGTFPGWPKRAAEITYCDPCCGSGHFLVEAFAILAALRQREDGLPAGDAAVAVLRDNLHGLELDGRCVQIAAFNVALAAWKLADSPIPLPSPHIAWVGAPPPMSRVEMAALADGDPALRGALETLYDQFTQAPILGSLLEVNARDLLDSDLRERGEAAFTKLRSTEPERAEGAVAARGLLDAAGLLSQRYVLLATNVPFLGRAKQTTSLSNYIASRMPDAKADLATAMLLRMRGMAINGGTVASVTPQNWLFLGIYKKLRERILASSSLSFVVLLGEHGFESPAAAGAFTALVVLRIKKPDEFATFAALDANIADSPQGKADHLRAEALAEVNQSSQIKNPDSRIVTGTSLDMTLLANFAASYKGIATGDLSRFIFRFWEIERFGTRWAVLQEPPMETKVYTSRAGLLRWDGGNGELHEFVAERLGEDGVGAWIRGRAAWNESGVAVAQMRDLSASLYSGNLFDESTAAIIPKNPQHLAAIWSYVSSPEYLAEVRKTDRSLKVPTLTLLKVPFNLQYWQGVAAEHYPDGLGLPYTDDPTQWLFHGHPAFAETGTELHVALGRLAGYRWPSEIDTPMRQSNLAKERIALAGSLPQPDIHGVLPLHGNANVPPLADRLRTLLAAAYDEPLSPVREQALVRAADTKLDKKEVRDATLETWLRDRAFRQHCALFSNKDGHSRPFLWQIWDGMKDGFSAFLLYHQLDRAALDKLTYTLLGRWIAQSRDEGNTARLEHAEPLKQTLAKIIEGERPFDIFVRWKSAAQQPLGWEPDLDDGVRLNIRPFMTAGILREQPKGISWTKDRGTDTSSAHWHNLGLEYGGKQGDRINDHHLTLAQKRAARSSL